MTQIHFPETTKHATFLLMNLELLLIAYRIKYKILFFGISNPSYASYNLVFSLLHELSLSFTHCHQTNLTPQQFFYSYLILSTLHLDMNRNCYVIPIYPLRINSSPFPTKVHSAFLHLL